MNFLWASRESQSVGAGVSVARLRWRGGRLVVLHWLVGWFTDEELEHALVLDLAAPVEPLEAVLLRDGVDCRLPYFAGGGVGVFDCGAACEGDGGEFGGWGHCGLDLGCLEGIEELLPTVGDG